MISTPTSDLAAVLGSRTLRNAWASLSVRFSCPVGRGTGSTNVAKYWFSTPANFSGRAAIFSGSARAPTTSLALRVMMSVELPFTWAKITSR